MMAPMNYLGLMLAGMVAAAGADARPHTFHVDAEHGDDARDGLEPESAWRSLSRVNRASLAPGDRVLFRRGQTWRGQLVPHSGDASGVIIYGAFGEGDKPILLGSVAADRAEDWEPTGQDLWTTRNQAIPLSVDVGNLIFDHGTSTGVKKWSEAELLRDGDYFYDARSRQVKLRSNGNPATRHRSMELALRRHIIDQSGCGYVAYENLDLRYGAAHGIGGSGVHHVTIRGCDLSFIGGGHQLTRPDGKPVRYGNGIEFWSSAHDCLVEGCHLWEIYDAALTNQGDGTNVQENITYRRNVIWNSEYSFEYWNRGPASRTRNIVFEYNTCVDAGYGWSHGQRPDPNGRHLMFYDNSAATMNVVVRDNIFCRATDSLLRLHGRDWTRALVMERNCWFQPRGPVLLWGEQAVGADEFAAFMGARGFDRDSRLADPKFLDAARHDYRLAPDSPARALDGLGEPAGALPDGPAKDARQSNRAWWLAKGLRVITYEFLERNYRSNDLSVDEILTTLDRLGGCDLVLLKGFHYWQGRFDDSSWGYPRFHGMAGKLIPKLHARRIKAGVFGFPDRQRSYGSGPDHGRVMDAWKSYVGLGADILFVDEESGSGGLDIPASCLAHCDELRETFNLPVGLFLYGPASKAGQVRDIARHVEVIGEMGYTLFLQATGDYGLEEVTRQWSQVVKGDQARRVAYWTGALVPLEPGRKPGSVFWRERFGDRTLAAYFEDYFRRARAAGADGLFFHSLCRFKGLPEEGQAQIAVAMERVFGVTD